GMTSGLESAPPKWLGNSRHGTSAMLRMKAPLFSEAISLLPKSRNQCTAVEIDRGSRRKAVGHDGEDQLRDILAPADAANRQACSGFGEHILARFFRHRGADRRVDDSGRDAVDADRCQLQRKCA